MEGLGLIGVIAGLLVGPLLMLRLRVPGVASGDPVATLEDTSVVIPARDEGATLPTLLASLARQPQAPREVIVVDDGSVDDTAVVAHAGGAVVVSSGELPSGWLGKPWACARGVEMASGSRIVLLDADTTVGPDGLQRIVAAHRSLANDGLLSVQPYHQVERGYEQLSAVANIVAVLASGMGLPGSRSARVAFGPCLVTNRVSLERAGGFAGVRGEMVEDAALARAYRAIGAPVECLAGGDALSFRMFPDGIRQLVDGWTRTLATGASRAPILLSLCAVGWVIAVGAVGLDGGGALAGWAAGGATPTLRSAVMWAVVSAQMAWMLRRVGSFHWWCSVLFPVPLVAFMALFARSAAQHLLRRPLYWRGRRIDMTPGAH